MQLLCLFKGILLSIINFKNISGHDYIKLYDNEDIQVLKCERCNNISVGFKKGEF